MTETPTKLPELFRIILRDYLAGAGESALGRAYEVGRIAMQKGLGVLDVVAMQQEALRKVLNPNLRSAELLRILKSAESFFAECLSPFEMTHRGFRDENRALHRLNEALEEETRRIAHALHDEAGQLMAAVYIELDKLASDSAPDFQERFGQIRKLLDQVEEQLRHFSHELRPTILDDLGLGPAIEFLAEGISKRCKLQIKFSSTVQGCLPVLIETVLYRITQEALTNAAKHARARQVQIRLLRRTGKVCLLIEDDGIGIRNSDLESKKRGRGLGLIGMRERLANLGGSLEIQSKPKRGTRLCILVPVER